MRWQNLSPAVERDEPSPNQCQLTLWESAFFDAISSSCDVNLAINRGVTWYRNAYLRRLLHSARHRLPEKKAGRSGASVVPGIACTGETSRT